MARREGKRRLELVQVSISFVRLRGGERASWSGERKEDERRGERDHRCAEREAGAPDQNAGLAVHLGHAAEHTLGCGHCRRRFERLRPQLSEGAVEALEIGIGPLEAAGGGEGASTTGCSASLYFTKA